MKALIKTIITTLLVFVCALSVLLIGPPRGMVLAASVGDICSTQGATQDNLTCGSCTSRGCVWESGTTDTCSDTTDATGKVSQIKVGKCLDQSPIVHDIQNIVNFLSAAVGVVVIAVIIIGGIQYSLAGDNASALTAARKRIVNGMIALFAFLFAWAFLQWLIPGGIFG